MKRLIMTLMLATVSFAPMSVAASSAPDQAAITQQAAVTVHYRTAAIDGVNIFYREAGPKDGPVVVLLPTSSTACSTSLVQKNTPCTSWIMVRRSAIASP